MSVSGGRGGGVDIGRKADGDVEAGFGVGCLLDYHSGVHDRALDLGLKASIVSLGCLEVELLGAILSWYYLRIVNIIRFSVNDN